VIKSLDCIILWLCPLVSCLRAMQSTTPHLSPCDVFRYEGVGESRPVKRHRSAEVLHGAGVDFMDFAERVGNIVVQRFQAYEITMEVRFHRMPTGRGHCQLGVVMANRPTRVAGGSLLAGELGWESDHPVGRCVEREQLTARVMQVARDEQLRSTVLQVAKDGILDLCARFGTLMLLAQHGFVEQSRGFSCRLVCEQLQSSILDCVLTEFDVVLNLVPANVE
jgi:hypothetical protein